MCTFSIFQTPGKLKMTEQNIVFKNSKTGKVEQIQASDLELVNFQNFVGSWGLRIFLKNGTLHRFGGFKDGVSIYFILHYYIVIIFFIYNRKKRKLQNFSQQIIKKICWKKSSV